MNSEKTGKFISELRKEKDLTQLQLSDLLHVSDKAVSRWETGKGFPDIGSLENIADALDVSVAELLRGERITKDFSKNETESYTADLLSLLKKAIRQKKIRSLITGFLLGAILLTLVVVHLNAPIYVKDAENALEIETLSDGRIVALLKDNVAGYEISDFTEPEDGKMCRQISCYRTLLHSYIGKKGQTIVVLGESDVYDYIYYYPGEDGDQLLYAKNGSPDYGVVTLPRLIYNYWILLGFSATLIGFVTYYVSRKKYYAGKILRISLIPLSFTIATMLVLIGRSHQVYNAVYYLSGILLLSFLIYVLLLYSLNRFRRNV
ncbi:MAG: helix-turn-helix transcriptional regulator [Erysipelotrichaceae bacterium]|nr:helix-turn-helix transcriptional regulator [Erysipelotrichaceae bacterium]